MKKTLFSLSLCFVALLLLTTCRTDESVDALSEVENITAKPYVKKSPWSEDEEFIKQAQAVFLEHADLDFISENYGDIYWDYGTSSVSTYGMKLWVPTMKGGEITSYMQATVKNGKIYFSQNQQEDFIRMFKIVMAAQGRPMKAKKEYRSSADSSIKLERGKVAKSKTEGCLTVMWEICLAPDDGRGCIPTKSEDTKCDDSGSFGDDGSDFGDDGSSFPITPGDIGDGYHFGGGGGNPAPSPNQEIIDNLDGYPCAQNLLKQLPNLNNSLSKLIEDALGASNKNYQIIFSASDFSNEDPNLMGRTQRVLEDGNTITYTIKLRSEMLETATQEYILSVMYHEFVHAYLAYEFKKLGSEAYREKYPYLEEYTVSGVSKFRFKKGDHQAFGPFIDEIADAIQSFNPSFPRDRAVSLAIDGVFDGYLPLLNESYNASERNGEFLAKGTKCKKS